MNDARAKSSLQPPVMGLDEVKAFLNAEFPQLRAGGQDFSLEALGPMTCQMRLGFHDRHLRPGGTISGPAMFALADVALYAAILAHIGPVALAVTTSLTINFLRKPQAKDLIAQCRLLKLGRTLAVGEVSLYSDGSDEIVAHATGTYAIPS